MLTNETTKLLPFEVLKNIKNGHFRVNQSLNIYVRFQALSSALHKKITLS